MIAHRPESAVQATESVACPACGVLGGFEPRGSHGNYVLLYCRVCDVVFADPMRAMDYNTYTVRNQYVVRDFLRIPQEDRMWNHREFLKMGLAAGGRLLDVGCGNGAFLRLARMNGYEVWGCELDRRSAEAARELFRLPRIAVGEMPDGPFDAITLWEVLEHVERPAKLVRDIRARLAPGGVFALSVPNRGRWPAFRYSWDDPPHHLTRWSRRALSGLLERNGFHIERIVYGWENVEFHLLEKLDVHVLSRLGIFMVKEILRRMIGAAGWAEQERLRRRATRLANLKYFLVKAVAMPLVTMLKGMGSCGAHLLVIARREGEAEGSEWAGARQPTVGNGTRRKGRGMIAGVLPQRRPPARGDSARRSARQGV